MRFRGGCATLPRLRRTKVRIGTRDGAVQGDAALRRFAARLGRSRRARGGLLLSGEWPVVGRAARKSASISRVPEVGRIGPIEQRDQRVNVIPDPRRSRGRSRAKVLFLALLIRGLAVDQARSISALGRGR